MSRVVTYICDVCDNTVNDDTTPINLPSTGTASRRDVCNECLDLSLREIIAAVKED